MYIFVAAYRCIRECMRTGAKTSPPYINAFGAFDVDRIYVLAFLETLCPDCPQLIAKCTSGERLASSVVTAGARMSGRNVAREFWSITSR